MKKMDKSVHIAIMEGGRGAFFRLLVGFSGAGKSAFGVSLRVSKFEEVRGSSVVVKQLEVPIWGF